MKDIRSFLFIAVISLSACSTSSATPTPAGSCNLQFSGDFNDSSTPLACATFSFSPDAGAGPGWTLNLSARSNLVSQFNAEIVFNAFPSAGTFTSETVANWSAVAVSSDLISDGSYCTYDSGSQSVPGGNLTLQIDSLPDAGATIVHGSLQMDLYVHAPAALDCGPSDIEKVSVSF